MDAPLRQCGTAQGAGSGDAHGKPGKAPVAVGRGAIRLGCVHTGRETELPVSAVIMVCSRSPNDALYRELSAKELAAAGITSLKRIGDCEAPGPIAWATYAGRRYAEELDEPPHGDALPFRREITALAQ